MRLPIRRGEKENRKLLDLHLTPAAIQRLQRELDDLEKRVLPTASAEMRRTAEMGDLSENAAYQHAKDTVRRTNNRILSLRTRITQAIPIQTGPNQFGRVTIGSTVTVVSGGTEKMYEIVGSQETSPGRGKISHASPLGMALLGHKVGDIVRITTTDNRTVSYRIASIT